jgi:hypothetical protein
VRDGKPLPGITPERLLSQLAWRTHGPPRPIRIRGVMDYHGLGGAPAATQAQIATRYDTTSRTIVTWIAAVRAAGTRVPLTAERMAPLSCRSTLDQDHLGRTRLTNTFGVTPPLPPATPVHPVTSPSRAPNPHPRAARSAVWVLAAVGPLHLDDLCAAVNRSPRRTRQVLTTDDLAAALTASNATKDAQSLWHPPAQAAPLPRYQAVTAAMTGRDVTHGQLRDILLAAGYAPSTVESQHPHPLIRRAGPNRYRLVGEER